MVFTVIVIIIFGIWVYVEFVSGPKKQEKDRFYTKYSQDYKDEKIKGSSIEDAIKKVENDTEIKSRIQTSIQYEKRSDFKYKSNSIKCAEDFEKILSVFGSQLELNEQDILNNFKSNLDTDIQLAKHKINEWERAGIIQIKSGNYRLKLDYWLFVRKDDNKIKKRFSEIIKERANGELYHYIPFEAIGLI